MFSGALAAETGDTTIYDLMTNDLADPVGIDSHEPVFSWKMASSLIGQKQTAYQLQVKTGDTTVWDSGKVESDASVGIVYDGVPLVSSCKYTWSVTVWDKNGNTVTSPNATFETALLEDNAFADTDFISYHAASGVTEYTIDVDFVITKGGVGLVFGATDASNFIMWQVNAGKNQIRPHFREGGAWVAYPGKSGSKYAVDALDMTGVYTGLNERHHLRIVVDGNTVETFMGPDGDTLTSVGTYTHAAAVSLGLVGVRQAKNEAGWFDNLTVTDKDGQMLYHNSFTDAQTNDIELSAGAISDGWLKMDGSSEVVCLQKADGNSLPAYRKTVTVRQDLVSAKLYTAGLGVYESYINGVRVGRKGADGTISYDELKPGFTQRNKRQFYSTFDVTWMLQEGENVLGAVVTDGWWRGVGNLHRGEKTAYLAKLILTYADGTRQVINTDTTWKSAKVAAVQSGTGIYTGERYDASVDQSWMQPGFDDGTWSYAEKNNEFTGVLDAWEGVSVIVRQDLERSPKSLTVYNGATGAVADTSYGDIAVVSTHADGEKIPLAAGQTLLVDFGQNFAGWEYFEIEGARGTVVTVEHGEWLNEAGGSVARGNDGPGGSIYNANYRTATANTIYTMSGNGVEAYHPAFSFYGFQYIEITASADITVHKVRGQVVTSVHNDTAVMETSDADVNQLLSNIRWGMYANYLSIPTDCPQRNERHGWTGDSQVFSQAGTYLTYSKSFLEKYLQDMRDAQADETIFGGNYNGAYSDIAPYVHSYGTAIDEYGNATYGEVGWGDAGIIIPWNLYMMYGDSTTIREHWDSMVRYMDFLETSGGSGYGYGAKDHLNLENSNKQPVGDLLAVAFFAWDALMMADMANAIGDTAMAEHYQNIYQREKQIFQERFVTEDGSLTRYEQTAQLYALYLDLLPNAESVAVVTDDLISSIEKYGNCMYTGFLGTSIITKTLTKVGRSDVAYTLLLQHDYPSWLYSVDQGANTIWERWNTYTAESGFGDVSMNSFNHYSYGAVAGWMFQSVAGIGFDPENPGFKNIVLAPAFDARLDHVKSAYESAYGLIKTETNVTGEGWTYHATVPANTSATVKLPVQGKSLTVNGKSLGELTQQTDGIVYTGTIDGVAVFEALAGSFVFRAETQTTELDWSVPQYCQHCDRKVIWTAYSSAANMTGGHYYLSQDITTTLTNGITPASNGSQSCLHLNGKTITCTTGNRVFNVGTNRTLNIMDHPENQGVLIRDNSKGNRGSIFNIIENGIVNVYGGTMLLGQGHTASYGALVYLDKTGQFHMYGGVLKNGAVGSSASIKCGGSIYASGSSIVTIHGGTIEGGTAPENGGNIYAAGTATLTINGGSILSGKAATGGNIYMDTGTTLQIGEDALIKYGNAASGGNLALVGATATMHGGSISYGQATGTTAANGGGNIRIDENSAFTVNDGSILDGYTAASNYGGNIYNYGTFTMSGGKLVRGNAGSAGSNLCNRGTANIDGGFVGQSVKGGSILNMSAGKLYVKGGTLSGLTRDCADAHCIRVWDSGKLYVSGGELTGGAVYADRSATIEVSGGSFTGSTLNMTLHTASAGDGTLKITGGIIGKLTLLDNCDAYDIQVTLSGKPVIHDVRSAALVKINALTEGAAITFTDAAEGVVFGTGDSASYLYSENGFVPVLEGTSLKWAKALASAVTAGEQTLYTSVQDAIDSESDYVKLLTDVTENVTISHGVYLDLNGHTLTGSLDGEGILYGMDSATDQYTTDTMGRITGTVSCRVETQVKSQMKQYLAIADADGYTFHRFYVGITKVSLRPGDTGFGYKARFCVDPTVREMIDSFGFTLQLSGVDTVVTRSLSGSVLDNEKEYSLLLKNFDMEHYGQTPVNAQVFLRMKDGTTMTSATSSYSMRTMLELLNDRFDSLDQEKKDALASFVSAFGSFMKDWSISNIG